MYICQFQAFATRVYIRICGQILRGDSAIHRLASTESFFLCFIFFREARSKTSSSINTTVVSYTLIVKHALNVHAHCMYWTLGQPAWRRGGVCACSYAQRCATAVDCIHEENIDTHNLSKTLNKHAHTKPLGKN